jgi:hypothetical protein
MPPRAFLLAAYSFCSIFSRGFSEALNIMHFYSIFTQNTSCHE